MAHLLTGIVLVGLGLWGIVAWWNLFGLVMRGLIPFGFLFFGLIAILAACRRLSQQTAPPEVIDPLATPEMDPLAEEDAFFGAP